MRETGSSAQTPQTTFPFGKATENVERYFSSLSLSDNKTKMPDEVREKLSTTRRFVAMHVTQRKAFFVCAETKHETRCCID